MTSGLDLLDRTEWLTTLYYSRETPYAVAEFVFTCATCQRAKGEGVHGWDHFVGFSVLLSSLVHFVTSACLVLSSRACFSPTPFCKKRWRRNHIGSHQGTINSDTTKPIPEFRLTSSNNINFQWRVSIILLLSILKEKYSIAMREGQNDMSSYVDLRNINLNAS